MTFSAQYKDSLLKTIEAIDLAKVEEAIEWLREARARGAQIFVCGNGGSAATASHFATDILKGASYGRTERFRIIALTDSLPTVSAYANDVHYDCVFAEQLKNFARPGDIVMAISGSGNSPNVVSAAQCGRTLGCRVLALTGRDGGKLGPAADLNIQVAETHMGRIEDAHMIICHMLAYRFMEET